MANSQYPLTNGDLQTNPVFEKYLDQDVFFNLAAVSGSETEGYTVNEHADLPLAVNKDKVRGQIFEETGAWLPTRKEINKGTADWELVNSTMEQVGMTSPIHLGEEAAPDGKFSPDSLKVEGSNVALEVNGQVLSIHRPDKKKEVLPGGVGSGNDLTRTDNEELNQEAAVIAYDPDKDQLRLMMFFPEGTSEAEKTAMYQEKFKQLDDGVILERFNEETGGKYAHLTTPEAREAGKIRVMGVETVDVLHQDASDITFVDAEGNKRVTQEVVVDNEKAHSFGIVSHAKTKAGAIPENWELHAVDPEKWNNPQSFHNIKDLPKMEGTMPFEVASEAFTADTQFTPGAAPATTPSREVNGLQ